MTLPEPDPAADPQCIIQQHEISELLKDDFAAVLDAVAEECETSGNDMGSIIGHPDLGEAYDAVAAAIRHLLKVGRECES